MTKFILIVFLIAPSLLVKAQPNEKVNDLLDSYVEVANIPGLSVAVANREGIVYNNSFGWSDIENNVRAESSTRYRIGSVTKLFTAVALMKLVEDGTIQLNEPVTTYVKDLPEVYQKITIMHLAGHLSGIRHYSKSEIYGTNIKSYPSMENAMEKFIQDTLSFEPGTKYQYSSYGYALLGAAMEKASRKNFTTLIRQLILEPAGMKNTMPEVYQMGITNKSQFYYPGDNEFTIATGEDESYKWPAGGYLATAVDLTLFGNALLTGKLVSDKSVKVLFEPLVLDSGESTDVGLGFRIGKDSKGRQVVSHGGTSRGGRAMVLIYPEENLTISLLANRLNAPLFEGEAETIAAYFLSDFIPENGLSGTYSYSAKNRENSMTGFVKLDENVLANFMESDLQIIDRVTEGENIRLIVLTRQGIINIWLEERGDVFTGKWGYDLPWQSFEMKR